MTTHQLEWKGPIAIPDKLPNGLEVFRSLSTAPGERVTKIDLHVRATHPYIADLALMLTAPNGTQAIIHKAGMGCDTVLDRSWVLDNFNGHEASGEWTLTVFDVVAGCEGRLDHWEMQIHTTPSQSCPKPKPTCNKATRKISKTSTCTIMIPDTDRKGIASSIEVEDQGTIKDIGVSVSISHTYVGDLDLVLISPQGHEMALAPIFGKTQGHFQRTFTPLESESLKAALNTSACGTWTLQVRDLFPCDCGQLDNWSLDLLVS